MSETPQKLQFVLIHGVGHGAWCWFKIRHLLETSGYKATCLDLKAAGIDRSDPNTIFSFDQYNAPLLDFLSNLPENEKVVLVGHSAGGLSLTDAIYKFPGKIHLAIYVAAAMLKNGFATDEDYRDADPDLSEYGDINEFEYGMGLDQPPTSIIIRQEFQREILYQMSPEEDSILASMLVRPGPIRALKPEYVGQQVDDSVPRVYIKTLQDHVLKQVQQESMIKRWQPSKILALESDHSPFFSNPSSLCSSIIKAAESVNREF